MITASTVNGKNIMPTIISVAESTHYLVGAFDASSNFIGLNQTSDVAVVNSLAEAKQYLRRNNIFIAAIEYQSAYDEMCGSDTSPPCRQVINL